MSVNELRRPVCALCVSLLAATVGCGPNPRAISAMRENETLRADKNKLERGVQDRDAAIAVLQKQVGDLQSLGPNRPVAAFSPVKLEIASLSGGADYDGKPGDDGINVYLRPKDADGDVVKVPGRMKVQVADHSNLHAPRMIGVYSFDDIEQVRKAWHGKLGTQHFTLKCPFPGGVALPPSRKLVVSAEFTDLLTGVTLTAIQEVVFSTNGP